MTDPHVEVLADLLCALQNRLPVEEQAVGRELGVLISRQVDALAAAARAQGFEEGAIAAQTLAASMISLEQRRDQNLEHMLQAFAQLRHPGPQH